MGNLIRGFCQGKQSKEEEEAEKAKEKEEIIEAILTNDLSLLSDLLHHKSHNQSYSSQVATCLYLNGHDVKFTKHRNEDTQESHRTAGCASSTHQRTGKRNNEVHTPCCCLMGLWNSPPLQLAVMTTYYHFIPDLLKRGARIDDRDKLGKTALHLASELLNYEAIKILLDCGANIDLATLDKKETALHLAVWFSSCKAGTVLGAGVRCIELLLLNGANVHMKDWQGREAIHTACHNGREDAIDLLISYGADVNSLTKQKESALFLFLERSANLRKVNLLAKLVSLSYPLKITNYSGTFPAGLELIRFEPIKELLKSLASEVWSLQDICKFKVKQIYGGNMECWLKGVIPTDLWNCMFNYTETCNSKTGNYSKLP